MEITTHKYGSLKHRIVCLDDMTITIRDYRKSGHAHNVITIDVLRGPEIDREAVGFNPKEAFIDFRYLLRGAK
jgi:hypothetical protein